MNYIHALSISLIGYVLLFTSLWGWGTIITAYLHLKFPRDEQVFNQVWLGFSGILLIAQIIHLFVSLSAYVSLPLLSIGVFVSGSQLFKRKPHIIKTITSHWWLTALYIVSVGVCLIWFASRAMLTPTIFDSGLYHFNSIRWLNEFPLYSV